MTSMVLSEKQLTLKQYIREKIRMLRKDFCIDLTDEQIAHMRSLKSEIAVDNYAHDLIFNR
jgi:hypothetical protein